MTDDLARMRAKKAAAAPPAPVPKRRGIAKLRLNADLDLELVVPGLDTVLDWSPELALDLARQMTRLARVAIAAKKTKGPKP